MPGLASATMAAMIAMARGVGRGLKKRIRGSHGKEIEKRQWTKKDAVGIGGVPESERNKRVGKLVALWWV